MMNFGEVKYCDIANGEGVRTSLFVSGCTHRCPGCFQPQTWDFSFGRPFTREAADAIVESLAPAYVDGLTVLGGEPMEPANQRALLPFLERVKAECPGKTVWMFSGDAYEELVRDGSPRRTEATDALLACVDVLVDGAYDEALHDVSLRFRGSSNQRVIDLATTRAAGHVVLWQDDAQYADRAFEKTG